MRGPWSIEADPVIDYGNQGVAAQLVTDDLVERGARFPYGLGVLGTKRNAS